MTRSVKEDRIALPRPESGPNNRLVALDGLRGVAALVVLFSHLALTLAPISDI